MKIVKLMGGLGNQMFQYAFAKALQEKFGETVLLDLSWFDEIKDLKKHPNATQRQFELGIFNLSLDVAKAEQSKFCINEQKSKLPKFICKLLKKTKHSDNILAQKNAIAFEPELLENKTDAYYIGYFHSEKYFSDIRDDLIKEFSLNIDMNEKNQAILEQIKNTNSVSLHVRRGDYINNAEVKAFHGTCSLDYYKKAIEHIASKIKNPHFFLFSDDLNWVIDNLKIDYPFTVVDTNDANTGYFDMELMKNCKHNIIANSSFSWWAAWLNQNPEKIVIAPNHWFNEPNTDKKDLLPQAWLEI